MNKTVYGVLGAAAYLSISKRTVYRRLKAGTFPIPSIIGKSEKKTRYSWNKKDLDKMKTLIQRRKLVKS